MTDTTTHVSGPMSAEALGDAIARAWQRYVYAFGESPHGTQKQCRALAVFVLKDLDAPPAIVDLPDRSDPPGFTTGVDRP